MITLIPQDSVVVNVYLIPQELEFHICDLADWRNGEDDTGSVAEERQTTHSPTATDPLTLHLLQDPPMIPDNFPMYQEWENPHTPRGSIQHFI